MLKHGMSSAIITAFVRVSTFFIKHLLVLTIIRKNKTVLIDIISVGFLPTGGGYI